MLITVDTPCWLKIAPDPAAPRALEWLPGAFLHWAQDHEDYGEFGPAPVPVAVARDAVGRIYSLHVERVNFGSVKPVH